MNHLSEPKNFRELACRFFSLRTAILFLICCSVLISELRFDFIERSLGTYLTSINQFRPKSGAIWEIGLHSSTAQKTLEHMLSHRQASEYEARKAETLQQLLAGLVPEKGVMISAQSFKKLFLKLSPMLSIELGSPYHLLKIFNDSRFVRTYFEKKGGLIIIYFLDVHNQVLEQIDIGQDLAQHFQKNDIAIKGTLNNLADFSNRIYPAALFFTVIDSLPKEVCEGIISEPRILLQTQGRINRIGISDEVLSGFIEIGYEFIDQKETKVVVMQAKEWAVWRLRKLLEQKLLHVNTQKNREKI